MTEARSHPGTDDPIDQAHNRRCGSFVRIAVLALGGGSGLDRARALGSYLLCASGAWRISPPFVGAL